MTDEIVRTWTREGVGHVVLNRPQALNAITPELDRALRQAVLDAQESPDVRWICLSGEGRAFCAGADLSRPVVATEGSAQVPEDEAAFRFAYLKDCTKPTVAAVNGLAIGVGALIALLCDLRVVSVAASFSLPYARLGLVAEYGIAQLLPRLIGEAAARRLLLTGERIDAHEAARIGLTHRQFEADSFGEQAHHYVAELVANCAPRSVQVIKQQIGRASQQSWLAAIQDAETTLHRARNGPDFDEARRAFKEKRPPRFTA